MRTLFNVFLVMVLGLGLAVGEAEAKRFGGGKSFGKQRESYSRQAEPPRQTQAPAAAPAPAAPAGNRWLGPLAGLAAGGLLASLFMGHGFEGVNFMDIALILLLVGGVFFILRALRRTPVPQPVRYAGYGEQTLNGMTGMGGTAPAPAAPAASERPAGFDDAAFLREAKGHFIRLQAAYDAGDLDDIREYTTPEVFAEISLQLQERGAQPSRTEVVTLEAAMADVVTEGDTITASVRFSGLLREDSEQATSFSEVWHVQKSLTQPGATWRIAGIQQD